MLASRGLAGTDHVDGKDDAADDTRVHVKGVPE